MRNFKKFLALVLAMLMVSACAVSVSAFDDVAAGDKYAKAIEMLADLGVISGRGDGKFYPNDTLTREEAAKIAAVTLAGADPIEWVAETTKFEDVTSKWSFAYINYAEKNKVMIGTGSGFAPKRELQIDEAIKIALAIADPSALRRAEIETAQAPTGYWATYYISEAEALNLTDELGTIRDFEAACSRGMFAQIIANVFNNVEDIQKAFGYTSIKATVDVVTVDNKKYVDIIDTAGEEETLRVTDEFFTAALVAEGYDKITAADLEAGIDTKPCYINIVYLTETKEITSIEVLTAIEVTTYDKGLIKVVKDADGNLVTTKVEVDGVQYIVNAADATNPSSAWGEGSSTVRGIYLSVDGDNVSAMATTTIPDFYEAFLYDDNGDGDYERAAIKEYYAGILVDAGKDESDLDGDDDKTEQLTTIKKYGKNADLVADYTNLVGASFSGETASYGNTPVLYRVDGNNVDILEVAKTDIKGEVANFKEDNYINLGESKVSFAASYINPGKWVLGQNVAIYTIGGKYVDVVNEDIATGMKEQTVLVDNVTVKDGVALIDGFIWNSNGTLTAVEDYEVVGIVSYDKLVSKAFSALKVVIGENTYAGLVGDGTPDDAGTAWKSGTKTVEFEEGHAYTFKVTNVGAYYAEAFVKNAFDEDLASIEATGVHTNLEIKNGYLYNNGDATHKMADAYTVLSKVDVADVYGAYAPVTYKILDSFKFENSSTRLLDSSLARVTAESSTQKVAFVYTVGASNTPVNGEQTKLNDGETIVKIYAVENEALAESTYLAQDIFTGAKVEVTGNAAGDYAIVKDGKIVDAAPLWMDTQSVFVTLKFDGNTITGNNTMIVDPADGSDNYLDDKVLDSGDVTFTNIKYWVADGDTSVEGDFKAGDVSTIFTTAGVNEFFGCIIDGVVVVLG